jgi:hypothetical protein
MEDHWFDTLNTTLVREKPRRPLLGAVATAITSLVHGAIPGAVPAKNKKKGKGKGKGRGKGSGNRKNRKKGDDKDKGKQKDKPTPNPATSCSGRLCAAVSEWDGNEAEIKFCEDKCELCRQAGTEFCIHEPDDEHPDVHATCCPHGEVCVEFACCPAERFCGGPLGPTCAPKGFTCCPDASEMCLPGVSCCRGEICRRCDPPLVLNHDTCECEDRCGGACVGPGLACCSGGCVDTRNHSIHCGGCDQPCHEQPGFRCCDFACIDVRFDNQHCGGGCEPCPPSRPQCCHGTCINPRELQCCPDHFPLPGLAPWCSLGQTCCRTPNGDPACCCNGVPC